MKCNICKKKFSEIVFFSWIKYFCSDLCKQEFFQKIPKKNFFENKKFSPIKKISSKNKNISAKFSKETKWKILLRDKRCILCLKYWTDCHHIFFWAESEYWENRNDLNKWVLICRDCHNLCHSCKKWEWERQKCIDYLN